MGVCPYQRFMPSSYARFFVTSLDSFVTGLDTAIGSATIVHCVREALLARS
jgi:hypothetical protein